MSSQVSRADLLRIYKKTDKGTLEAAARLLGFHAGQVKRQSKPLVRVNEEGEGASKREPLHELVQLATVPFWAVVAKQNFSSANRPGVDKERETFIEPHWREKPSPPTLPGSTLGQASLLRAFLWQSRSSCHPDTKQLVQLLSRLCAPHKVPNARIRVHETVYVLLDNALHLTPFKAVRDAWLETLKGTGIQLELAMVADDGWIYRSDGGGTYSTWQLPPENSTVLAIGDAGELSDGDCRRRWLKLARRLKSRRCRALLLKLNEASSSMHQGWQRIGQMRLQSYLPKLFVESDDNMEESLERLLTLCSPLIRVEPRLAYAISELASVPSSALAQLWLHPLVASPSAVAATLQAGIAQRYREPFIKLCKSQPELIRQTLAQVRHYRANLAVEIWYTELLGLPVEAHSLLSPQMKEELQEAQRWIDQVDRHRATMSGGAYHHYFRRRFEHGLDFRGQPLAVRHSLSRLFRDTMGGQAAPPSGYDPSAIEAMEEARLRHFSLSLDSDNDKPLLRLSQQSEGQCLASLRSLTGEVLMEGQSIMAGQSSAVVPLSSHPSFLIRSDLDSLRIARITKPQWASAIGRDRFGLWCEISLPHPDPQRIPPVRQRLRYCPPGEFWMGLSEDEEGGYDDEGPQHRVRLSEGFWIFDTPVTQMLWTAVMSDNPSYFKGDLRPVESVSFERCTKFLEVLNKRVPDLNLMLPTEAQWEYACRAGSEGARYGDVDDIAWYDDNANAETHPVAQKLANAWGVYDTLGNVDEWCRDWRTDYGKELKMDDPIGSTTGVRAVRGGSWYFSARNTRAASRDPLGPDGAVYGLGFRCLRVQNA